MCEMKLTGIRDRHPRAMKLDIRQLRGPPRHRETQVPEVEAEHNSRRAPREERQPDKGRTEETGLTSVPAPRSQF